MNKKLIFLLIFNFIIFFTIGIIFAALIYFEKEIPNLEQLQNIRQGEISKVFSSDSVLLKEFYEQKRELTYFPNIPKRLIQALIAIEDQRFYHHWGFDIIRFTKAVLVNLSRMEKAQGGSTITQQLARGLFLSQEKKISRKIKEIITAVKIEKMYSKDEIITFYLNDIYYGPGIYGIKAAAEYYFNKELNELNLEDCAFLAGIIQAPGLYLPNKHPKRSAWRRNLVLKNMLNMGFITPEQFNKADKTPLPVVTKEIKQKAGDYYIEYARNYIMEEYGYDYLYKEGITINIGMNYRHQRKLEELTNKFMNEHQKTYTPEIEIDSNGNINFESIPDTLKGKILQTASLILDIQTGKITAMIGGRDFQFSQFNRAIQAKRQPGSAFKPFLYTAAIDNGFTPASQILDQPIAVKVKNDELWIPQNYSKNVEGFLTLRKALKLSKNLVSIRLIGKIKPQTVVFYAKQMGIKSHLDPFTSLSMGTSVVSLEELLSAYTPFATVGEYLEPFFISNVKDKNGNILESNEFTLYKKKVIRPETAYIITDMMKDVINSGTGYKARAWGLNFPAVAGKTGTTDNYTDAWFVGFSPYYLCAVWVGFDNNQPMEKGSTGSQMALPIWIEIMKYLHVGLLEKDFPKPNGIVTRELCSSSHLLATPHCPQTYKEIFIKDHLPEPCDQHGRSRKKSIDNMEDFDLKE